MKFDGKMVECSNKSHGFFGRQGKAFRTSAVQGDRTIYAVEDDLGFKRYFFEADLKEIWPLDGKRCVIRQGSVFNGASGVVSEGQGSLDRGERPYPYYLAFDEAAQKMYGLSGCLVKANDLELVPEVKTGRFPVKEQPTMSYPKDDAKNTIEAALTGWGFSAKEEDIDFERISREAADAGFEWLVIEYKGAYMASVQKTIAEDMAKRLNKKVAKTHPSPHGYVLVSESLEDFKHLVEDYRKAKEKRIKVKVTGGKL